MQWPADRIDRDRYPGPGEDLPVFYNDLDPNGHLNNVAIGRFFEQARVTAVRGDDLHRVLGKSGAHFLVARVVIDYLSEGQWATPLHVRTRLARVGGSSLVIEQAAWQGDRVTALAEVTLVVLVDGRPAPLAATVADAWPRAD